MNNERPNHFHLDTSAQRRRNIKMAQAIFAKQMITLERQEAERAAREARKAKEAAERAARETQAEARRAQARARMAPAAARRAQEVDAYLQRRFSETRGQRR